MKCIQCGRELSLTGDDYINGKCSFCKCLPEEKQSTLYGWICPRCGVVHSPFVTECYCPPPTITSNGNTFDNFNTEQQ
jgi:hypothetical protein